MPALKWFDVDNTVHCAYRQIWYEQDIFQRTNSPLNLLATFAGNEKQENWKTAETYSRKFCTLDGKELPVQKIENWKKFLQLVPKYTADFSLSVILLHLWEMLNESQLIFIFLILLAIELFLEHWSYNVNKRKESKEYSSFNTVTGMQITELVVSYFDIERSSLASKRMSRQRYT